MVIRPRWNRRSAAASTSGAALPWWIFRPSWVLARLNWASRLISSTSSAVRVIEAPRCGGSPVGSLAANHSEGANDSLSHGGIFISVMDWKWGVPPGDTGRPMTTTEQGIHPMLRLHGFAVSNYFNMVKLALLEKGIPFEINTVRGNQSPEFLAISPRGKVPCLETEQGFINRSEEHTSELQSRPHLVCRLLLEKKNA